MQKIVTLESDKQFSQDMYHVVVSLQELSVLEMQHIRKQVLATRSSLQKILDIFLDVRFSQRMHVEATLQEKADQQQKTRVFVFLSQNQRFSDTNIDQVWKSFRTAVQEQSPDKVIILGKTGEDLAKGSADTQFSHAVYITLPTTQNSSSELHTLFEHLHGYDEVVIFHGKFENVLTQTPSARDISGHGALLSTEETTERENREFFFEPSLEKLIHYFEQEVERGLLQQTLTESRLAHVGSRVKTLESSRNAIEEKMARLSLQLNRAKRRHQTKQQQQRLAGMSLWK